MKHKLSKFLVKIAVFLIVIESIAGFLLANPLSAKAASANVSQLVFTTASQTIMQNSVSQVMTVQTQNASNTPETVDGIHLLLSTTSTTGLFSSNNAFASTTTILAMNKDTANRNFYYKDSTAGNFTITVTAQEYPGWTAAVQTIVVNADSEAPVIAGHDDVLAEATSAAGAVVNYSAPNSTDNVDGTLPADCTPAPGSTFPIGETIITCTKTDAAGNIATPTNFKVTVSDTTAPIVTINGENDLTIEKGSVYADAGATATDGVDGDLTGMITVTNTVDTSNVGVYVVSYSVSDLYGNNATATRTVHVVDTTKPVITITKNPDTEATNIGYTMKIDFDSDSIIKQYRINGEGWIDYEGEVSFSDAGKYVIDARGIDGSGNSGESTIGLVIDKTAPIVNGVKNDEYYNCDKTVTVIDDNAVNSITLNGAAFISGSTISADGDYELIAKDNAGNMTTVSFGIYKTLPELKIENNGSGFILKYDAKIAAVTNVYLNVYDKDDLINPIRSLAHLGSAGTFTVNDLPKGVTYYFKLQTLKGAKVIGYSETVTGFVEKPAETPVPAAPDNTAPSETVQESWIPLAHAVEEVTPTPSTTPTIEPTPTGQTKGTEDRQETNRPSRSRDILVIIALLAIAGAAYYGYKKLPESDEISEPAKIKIEEKPQIAVPTAKGEKKEEKPVKKTAAKNDTKKKKGKK